MKRGMQAAPPLVIPSEWNLPAEFRNRLGTQVGRQRVMQSGNQLLILAHHVPEANERSRRGVVFWKDDKGVWKSNTEVQGSAAIREHLERFSEKLEHFESLETKALSSHEYLQLLEGLAPVVRSMRNLYEVLEESRKQAIDDRDLIDLRDYAYELSRQGELLYDDSKNRMEVAVVRRAEEQAKASHQMTVSAHRLNIMAALFFPLATLGAILGTTLTDNWSWSHSWEPFVVFLSLGVIGGFVLAYFISLPDERRTRVHD